MMYNNIIIDKTRQLLIIKVITDKLRYIQSHKTQKERYYDDEN